MNTSSCFLSGMLLGFGAALLFAPMPGNELRRMLSDNFKNANREHTYNIKELMSSDSDTLEHIKEHLQK